MLQLGDAMPDFTLPVAYADGRRAPIQFKTFLGKGPVVVAFYPLAFTGVCTKEVCDLRDHLAEMEALEAQVLGFSIDAAPSNAHFAKLQGLAYGIVSDANREVLPKIWEMQTVNGVHHVAKRGYLVLDAEGVVVDLWITDAPEQWVGVGPIRAALEKLRAR